MASNLNEIIIAVMGMTGVGKSTFIKTLTMRDDIVIGHGLNSETSDVREYRLTDRGINYVLVDTPGFDDTYLTDEEITTKILEWLASSYKTHRLLNGVLYLHRLSDKRMGGSALSNLRMFKKLLGPQGLRNVILGTTFWENLTLSEIQNRKAELIDPKKDFWAKMVDRGSKVMDVGKSRESCLAILRAVANNHKFIFQVQEDIVDQGVGVRAAALEALIASQRSQKAFDESARDLLERIRQTKSNLKPRAHRTRLDSFDIDMLQEEKRCDEELRARQTAELENLKRRLRQQEMAIERTAAAREAQAANLKRYSKKGIQRNADCEQHKPPTGSRPYCSVCKSKIGRKGFYHCCLCEKQCFLQCVNCGNQCPDKSHPQMEFIKSRILWFF